MIPTPHEIDGIKNATGVYLEHAIETDLAWLSQLLPSARRVGIIHSAEGAARAFAAERAAGRARFTIRAVRVNGAQDISPALASLTKEVDVILGLSDSLVFNAETARAILTFSFRERIPVVGPSTGWVRAGAIYALHPDYHDVGRQTAKLALRVISGHRISSLPPVRPRQVRFSINRRTAIELRVNMPDLFLRTADEVIR
jgi:putative tryptophan/tyrosine transport system substrate-binding protein